VAVVPELLKAVQWKMGTEEAAQNREQEQEAKEVRRERVVGAHYGN